MSRWTGWPAAAVLLAVAAAACDNVRPLKNSGPTAASEACVRCHGGADNQTGAPPRSVHGRSDPAEPGVGAHTAHVTAGALGLALTCRDCHRDPRFDSTEHMDGRVEVEFGDLARAGGAAPHFDAAEATCSNVYCHGAFRNGNSSNALHWTQVGTGQAACGSCHGLPPGGSHPVIAGGVTRCSACHAESVDVLGHVKPAPAGKHLDGQIQFSGGHDAAWTDPASPAFHAFTANVALETCKVCHGPALDGVGGSTTVACAQCHGAGGPGRDFGTCNACHGGADNATGAPPAATWGHAGDPSRGGGTADAVRVGAHSAHVASGPLARAFDCSVCHVKPSSFLTPGHLDAPTATVTFAGVALAGGAAPAWTRAAATCASTYCHGATLPGGTRTAPVWTAGAGEATCGTCHGVPPPAPHVQNTACGSCHDGYTQTSVNLLTHVDGKVDVAGLTCSSCHGSSANPAPPAGTAGETSTTAVAVGAHQQHLVAGPLSAAVACTECHVLPTSPLHSNGTVELTWGTLATKGGAQPRFDAATATCTGTYCHGATLNAGGTLQAPVWTTVNGTQAACGTCHAAPPPAPHPQNTSCGACHNGYTPTSVNTATHIDGTVQVNAGHDAAWMDPASPTFHAFSANAGLGTCQACHGVALDGVGGITTVACAQCHGVSGPGRDFGTCTGCHGGTDNQSGAPPAATWGHDADPARGGGTAADRALRVGAHTAHLTGALSPPMDCGVCHTKPVDMLSPGHIDGSPTAGVVLDGLAALGTASPPTWNRTTATCAGTYCHGATILALEQSTLGSTPRGANVTPTWTGGSGQATCGTCHGLPPDTGAHFWHVITGAIGSNLPCSACHNGYPDFPGPSTPGLADTSLHVNGVKDVVLSPDIVEFPADALTRITGWDQPGCHAVAACHGLLPF